MYFFPITKIKAAPNITALRHKVHTLISILKFSMPIPKYPLFFILIFLYYLKEMEWKFNNRVKIAKQKAIELSELLIKKNVIKIKIVYLQNKL